MQRDRILIYNDGLTGSRFDIGDLTSMKLLKRDPNWARRNNNFETEDGTKYFDIPEGVDDLVNRLAGFTDPERIFGVIPIARGATINFFDGNKLVPETVIDKDGGKRRGVFSYFNTFSDQVNEAFFDMADKKTMYNQWGLPVNNFEGALIPGWTLVNAALQSPSIITDSTRIALAPEVLARLFMDKETLALGCEPTYLGCHTGLWDFKENTWSKLAYKIDNLIYDKTGRRLIGDLVPDRFSHGWDTMGYIKGSIADKLGIPGNSEVMLGGHDSTVADIPVIAAFKAQFSEEAFVHFQAGSWGMARLIGAEYTGLPEAGFTRTVLLQGDLHGNPVPSVLTPTGNEFDHYAGPEGVIVGKLGLDGLKKDYSNEKLSSIINEKQVFITPGVEGKSKGLGPFPKSEAKIYGENKVYNDRSGETAYIALNLETAVTTATGIELISDKEKVVLSAGAIVHPLYRELVATLLSDREVYFIEDDKQPVTETTAYGGLVLAKANRLEIHPYNVDVRAMGKLTKVDPIKELVQPLKDYRVEFEKRCNPA